MSSFARIIYLTPKDAQAICVLRLWLPALQKL